MRVVAEGIERGPVGAAGLAPETITVAALRKAGRRALPWRYVVPRAVLVWLVSRLMDVVLTVLFVPGGVTQRLDAWRFFDARFYLVLAQVGYSTGARWDAPFFPLYPLLMHPLVVLAGTRSTLALVIALAVANVGTLAAFVFVGLLAAHEARTACAAWLPMLLLAASPLAVFLAGAYSDGLFIALAASALLAARRGRWDWAALAAALASVARPFGVLLVLAVLVEYASQHAWWWRIRTRQWSRPTLAPSLLIAAPLAALSLYMTVLQRKYGDPLILLHVEGVPTSQHYGWGHGLRWPWQTLALAGHEWLTLPHWSWPSAHLLLDLVPVLLCLVVALITARSAPGSFTVLTLGVVLLCLVTPLVQPGFPDPLASDGRYCYAAVPVLLQLAGGLRRLPRWGIVPLVLGSLALQAALTVFVLRGGWLV